MTESLHQTTTCVLASLLSQPQKNAMFLNTLSLLEYTGARKIMKSQDAAWFTADLLDHVAEEVRHARVFKRLALQLSNGVLTTYGGEHLLCGYEANRYMQTVDHAAEAVLARGDQNLNYLYTTLLIEERANEVYPIYESLADGALATTLRAVVREENNHLKQVLSELTEREPLSEKHLTEMRREETKAFTLFFESISLELALPANANIPSSLPRAVHLVEGSGVS